MDTIITLTEDFDYFKLYKGDQIIVDHESHPKTGDIVITEHHGKHRVHRFERANGIASLWPPHDEGLGLDDILYGIGTKIQESRT